MRDLDVDNTTNFNCFKIATANNNQILALWRRERMNKLGLRGFILTMETNKRN